MLITVRLVSAAFHIVDEQYMNQIEVQERDIERPAVLEDTETQRTFMDTANQEFRDVHTGFRRLLDETTRYQGGAGTQQA